MRKLTLLISVLFVFVNNSFSQDKSSTDKSSTDKGSKDKGYIAISLGSSTPTGDFGSKDVNNSSAGLAKTGAIFDISFAYKLGKSFGLSAMIRGQANPVDNQVLLDELYKENPTVSWTADSKAWTIGGLLFGGYGSFPIGQGKTSFDARAMIGFLHASSPDITLTGVQGGTSAWVKLNSASATSFSYLFGAGFKFNVGSKVCLLLNLDYLGSSPEFQNVKTTTSIGTSDTHTFKQSFGTINFGVGVGLRL